MKPIKVLTPAQLAKEIKRRNRIFKSATAAGKRVLIAKDVLEQLRMGRLVVKTGSFLNVPYHDKRAAERVGIYSMQKALLSGLISQCQVCELGGLAMSCILFNNKTDVNEDFSDLGRDIKYDRKINNGLNKIFSNDQLILIEQAFEKGKGFFQPKVADVPVDRRAVAFGRKFEKRDRFKAILGNIIKNKGTFIP